MKKILSISLICMLLITFSSCKNNKENVSSVGSSSQTISGQTSSKDVLSEVERKAQNAIDTAVQEHLAMSDFVQSGIPTQLQKAKATYIWLYRNFKYRAVAVDVSGGYTDELTTELADYYFKFHRGSCEHYAAVQKVFFDLLDLETYYVEGERYDAGAGVWGEHVWLIVHYKDAYYHVDGLFGGNHTANLTSMLFVPDSAIEATHRWDREYYPACTEPQLLN